MKPNRVKPVTVVILAIIALALALSGCLVREEDIAGLWRNAIGTATPAGSAGSSSRHQVQRSGSTSGKVEIPTDTGSTEVPGQGQDTKDGLWIDVSIADQEVKILQGDKVIKRMTASTGMEGHETPLGTFQIQNRGLWFYNEKYKQGAKYWVSFKDWGLYLFHSVAMDKDQKVIPEEAAKLGKPASHGCIRLSVEDAKWIYDNIPEKTKVVIHR